MVDLSGTKVVVYEVVVWSGKDEGVNGLYEVVVLWRKMGVLGGAACVGRGAEAMGWRRRWWRRLVTAVMVVVVVVVRGHSVSRVFESEGVLGRNGEWI